MFTLLLAFSWGNLTLATESEGELRAKMVQPQGRVQFLLGDYDLQWGRLIAIEPGIWEPRKLFLFLPDIGLSSPVGPNSLSYKWIANPGLLDGEKIVGIELRSGHITALRTRLEDKEYSIDMSVTPYRRTEVVPGRSGDFEGSLEPVLDDGEVVIGQFTKGKGERVALVLKGRTIYEINAQKPSSGKAIAMPAVEPGDLLLSVAYESGRIFEVYVLDGSRTQIFRLHGQLPTSRRHIGWLRRPKHILGKPVKEEVCQLVLGSGPLKRYSNNNH